MKPGQMAFTRTVVLPISRAMPAVSAWIAAFEAA